MRLGYLVLIFVLSLSLLEVATALECVQLDETYVYKSALFHVKNANKIRVTVYNSMNDLHPRCFSAWIIVNGKYINLDGLPYSPSNWEEAWKSTAPYCYSSGYQTISGNLGYVEYDLEKYVSGGYTGDVEVRVSSDCWDIERTDPCFCWKAKVEVVGYYTPTPTIPQYCYFDIYVKNQYGYLLDASIYLDGKYFYGSHVQEQVTAGTHTVLASKPGYTSDSKTVSCVCGETKRVDLVLTASQACIPGEIRNRYCYCSTQVVYEKCKSDGSGWKTVIEDCLPGYSCQNGYCVKVSTCTPGYLDEYRCSGNWRERKYLYSDCSTDWKNWEYCDYGCSGGSCLPEPEKDGWYNTGNERCNLYGLECGTGTREREQEYRDYTCFGVTCTYTVTQRRWISMGSCYQDCPSGYTCQAGYCIKVTTTIPGCSQGYSNNYRCYGNWVQREYKYSDCSTDWKNWEYCDYGCSGGSCLPEPKEPCKISISVSTPTSVLVGESVTTSIKITNSGDVGGYVSFSVRLCKENGYCYKMSCDVDSTLYISAHSTRVLSCSAKSMESGRYRVKISYSGCDQSDVVYSKVFLVEKKNVECTTRFLDEFGCDGNWKLQLYRYSDCSTAWIYVEYCAHGCLEGTCLTKPTTTTILQTTQQEEIKKEEKLPITGLIVLTDQHVSLLVVLIILLIVLLLLWLLKNKKLMRKDKPEWFGKDC